MKFWNVIALMLVLFAVSACGGGGGGGGTAADTGKEVGATPTPVATNTPTPAPTNTPTPVATNTPTPAPTNTPTPVATNTPTPVPTNTPTPTPTNTPTPTVTPAPSQKLIYMMNGREFSCALDIAGDIFCWGRNHKGQLGDSTTTQREIPTAIDTSNLANGEKITYLTGGQYHVCGITSLGNTFCWGENGNGQLGINSTTDKFLPTAINTTNLATGEQFKKLIAGNVHTCGVTNHGNTFCWGGNASGQLGNNTIIQKNLPTAINTSNLAAGETFKTFAAESNGTCGITTLGNTFCWGINSYGQVGDNTTTKRQLPTAINTTNLATGETFVSLGSGLFHYCGITNLGNTLCWGYNLYGQLGDNTTTVRHLPTAISTTNLATGEKFTQIVKGKSLHTCGLTSMGNTFCWGENAYGDVGDNTTTKRELPTAINTSALDTGERFTYIGAGTRYACGITSFGNAFCWGMNTYGQVGDNTMTQRNLPTAVVATNLSAGNSMKTLGGGRYHTCGIATDGEAFCWGRNTYGALGDNTVAQKNLPIAVTTTNLASGEKFVHLPTNSVGYYSCGITSLGNAFCWGQNSQGQLGDNSTTNRYVPTTASTTNFANGEQLTTLDVGYLFSCGISNHGNTFCWGYNSDGQLGDNSTTGKELPSPIVTTNLATGESFVELSTGSYHVCALSNLGNIFCWGGNSAGPVGDNSTTDRHIPTAVVTTNLAAGEKFTQVTASQAHSCGLTNLGNTFCWGLNSIGTVGDNTTTDRHIPTAIDTTNFATGEKIVKLESGAFHNCGVTSLGNTFCWGKNANSQLGDSTVTQRNLPTAVDATNLGTGELFVGLAMGYDHSCGITNHRNTFCWGKNSNGQLGDDTTDLRSIPTAVDISNL